MNSNEILQNIIKATEPPMPKRIDWRIGSVGAGFIVRDCQLKAYRNLGFNPVAITSLSRTECEEVAKLYDIPKVYDTWIEMLNDDSLEIIDIAIPPHEQLAVVREAVKHRNIKGILCQKPLAMSLEDVREIVRLGEEAGIPIAVNSNMRFDQSMRALKYLLDMNLLGEAVIATIEMRAIPHWQRFLAEYDKLELFGMGIHHVDIFRYLFGDPDEITALCRTDPRTKFAHVDGITQYTYKYKNDLLCTSLDDVWAWPNDPCEKDTYIKWRVEGLDGMASGTIGWPKYPEHCPSTLKFTCKEFPNRWLEPTWDTVWFPDAFGGTMSSLLCAVENGTVPEISARDNISTIACVESCYKSIREKRTVQLAETLKD
ncbi:MAG: Gfo/Idh/MocA family oxidoreductase [Oscillospiraceae bacterium]